MGIKEDILYCGGAQTLAEVPRAATRPFQPRLSHSSVESESIQQFPVQAAVLNLLLVAVPSSGLPNSSDFTDLFQGPQKSSAPFYLS